MASALYRQVVPLRRSIGNLGRRVARKLSHTGPEEPPPGHIRIGQEHYPHRRKKKKRESPFLSGTRGTAVECVEFQMEHIIWTGLGSTERHEMGVGQPRRMVGGDLAEAVLPQRISFRQM